MATQTFSNRLRTLVRVPALLQAFPWRIVMLMSPRTRVGNLEIFDLRSATSASDDYFATIRQALELIQNRQPVRFNRILRDVRRIVVADILGAEFWPHMRACALSVELLGSGSLTVALALVHEATHARLHAARIPYDANSRERIERICVRQEVIFAQQFPDATSLVDEIEGQLDKPWWSDSALFERRLYLLKRAGASSRVLRCIRAIFAPR